MVTTGRLLSSAGAQRLVSSDASETGAGALFYDHTGQKHVATSTFNAYEAGQSSTYRELKTMLFALHAFASFLHGKREFLC